jgi:catechol 2,3-dioxygenase-like lactoylglutathione lyase family enzyme
MIEVPKTTNMSNVATPYLSSIAMRTYHSEAMINFYSEAFGMQFIPVETGPITSQFAELQGITLKFIPIRDGADFFDYPVHQLGFWVPDIERALAIAIKYGGKKEGKISYRESGAHAAVRDPDGNTIELFSVNSQQ